MRGDAAQVSTGGEGSSIQGGNDTLDAGAGDDLIVGDWQSQDSTSEGTIIGGDDTMTGGAGDDWFLFLPGSGRDVITDLVAGAGTDDVLDVSAYGIDGTNFHTVLTEDAEGNAVLAFDTGDTVTLLHVDQTSLHADDFGIYIA